MPPFALTIISLHAAAAFCWIGASFAAARTAPVEALRLFPLQIGSAIIVILTGALLWHFLHIGGFGRSEAILATGAAAAVIAVAIQRIVNHKTRRTLATALDKSWLPPLASAEFGQRVSLGLLAIAIVCMVAWRYA